MSLLYLEIHLSTNVLLLPASLEGCSWIPVRVASLCFWGVFACCLLPGLPDPTCCSYLIFCPILECLSLLRLQPLPSCSIPLLTRFGKGQRAVGKGEEKEHSGRMERCSWHSGVSGTSGWPVSWAECEKIAPIVTEKVQFIFTNTFHCQHILDF